MKEKTLANIRNAKGIYLLPNILTTLGLFAGFYSIILSIDGNFEYSAIAIFIAMIWDGLDGRVARLTNTSSDFGAEYDSMADMVSFGIAPSILMYNWGLSSLGKIGWFVAFIYVAGAALRLARFNVQVSTADKNFFQGLNSPSAAALLAGTVWISIANEINGSDISFLVALLTMLSGLLMVSNFKYHSFKNIDLKNPVSFIFPLIVVLFIAIISMKPALVLFLIFLGYAVSGPIITIKNVKTLKLNHVLGDPEDNKNDEKIEDEAK